MTTTDSKQQKTALVTGALGGIGTAICMRLVNDGYKVIATLSKADPERQQTWCEEHGLDANNFDFQGLDVSNHDKASEQLAQIIDNAGQIDVLVNAAGITRDTTFKKMSFEQWTQVINTNLTSLYTVIHPIFLKMLEQGHGRIVNISSVNGLKGQYGQTNYCATKAGIIGFSKSLALEGAKAGITVNVVAPGYTGTPMVMAVPEKVLESIKSAIPMQRLATPDEIAAAVMYLISDDAAYVTGETISINGGQYMH